ncbi:B3/B4 domain-containing protein [Desulforudis sp. 1088]|uniref:B3/B4 domain-containing protein n=1 Tax=unclassified Candidatus Desulforudis TaxID=2635950 RepID=UPI003CE4CBD5
MKFVISEKVFEALPTVCFGAVVARGVDNRGRRPEINALLDQSIVTVKDKFKDAKLKEHPDVLCYREAFQKLGLNPNKFPCSVEALTARVLKGGSLPDINPAVNLVNAISLKYTLPMGAHDLDTVHGDMHVRFSSAGDVFLPFGQNEPEILEEGELVYIDGREVRTRRWIWRQSDRGKVISESRNIFFPIDGFSDCNREAVLAARDELAGYLQRFFKCEINTFYLDIDNRVAEF